MIGVPLINDSTGRTQMNSTVDLLDEWKVKDEVIGVSIPHQVIREYAMDAAL